MDTLDDDVFKAELYATFYHEALGHCASLLSAAAAVRGSDCSGPAAAGVATAVRNAAHALKGSAATLALARLSAAAAALEASALRLLAPGVPPPPLSLRALAAPPAAELCAVLAELRAFVRFFLDWVDALVRARDADVAR
jgi:HPt (histidine-containing phosphotransfer) domain-containing protein